MKRWETALNERTQALPQQLEARIDEELLAPPGALQVAQRAFDAVLEQQVRPKKDVVGVQEELHRRLHAA